MKQLLGLLCIYLLLLCSCSNDDEESGNILVKKIITTSSGTPVTSDFSYGGNKLISITDSNELKKIFTYAEGLITHIDYRSPDFLIISEIFLYNADHSVTSYRRFVYNTSAGYKYLFVYNNDNTVSIKGYFGDLTIQNNLFEEKKLFFQNAEVIKKETYNMSDGSLFYSNDYTYDQKNNPFRNILGFDKISFCEGTINGFFQNLAYEGTTSSGEASFNTFGYTYNSNQYPKTKVYSFIGGNVSNATDYQHFY